MIRLERVIDSLPAGFDAMRAEARAEGHRMLDTLADEWESGVTRFDRENEALLGAYADGVLVGVGGLTQDPIASGVLRMRRFYCRAAFRRLGAGRVLATALLAMASGWTVAANAARGSEAFWEALGFESDRRDGHTNRRAG